MHPDVKGEVTSSCYERCKSYRDLSAERDMFLQMLDEIAELTGAKEGTQWTTLGVLGAVRQMCDNAKPKTGENDGKADRDPSPI